jgi:hypothetical protein
LELKPADFAASAKAAAAQAALKERVVGWARAIAARLAEVGVEVEATWSGEEPIVAAGARGTHGGRRAKGAAARVVFASPTKKHAILALKLDQRHVEVSLESFAPVYARDRVSELVAALGALPEQFELGGAHRIPAYTAGEADVRALLEDDGALWLGWSLPRDLALQHASILGEQLGDAIVALVAVFRIVTGERAPAPSDRAPGSAGGGAGTGSGGMRRGMLHAKRVPLRRARADVDDVDPKAPIERGTRVRVLAGPFTGKAGIVQELDGRGGARVMLGLLAARVAVKDLVASTEGRAGRAVLASSHRRPRPVR